MSDPILSVDRIRDAERLRDVVKRTWNPPLFGAAGYATVAQTAVMQTLAIVFGKEFLGAMTPIQERTIDLGLSLLGEVLHRQVALQTWVIEYEIPPLRAIYNCEVNCETEQQARSVFSLERPGYQIRSVRVKGGAV